MYMRARKGEREKEVSFASLTFLLACSDRSIGLDYLNQLCSLMNSPKTLRINEHTQGKLLEKRKNFAPQESVLLPDSSLL